MRPIHGNVVCEQSANALIYMSAQGLIASPEQAMMDDEQIRARVDRPGDGLQRRIYRHSNPPHRTDVLHLKAVECIGIVGYLLDAKHRIEILDDRLEWNRRHD